LTMLEGWCESYYIIITSGLLGQSKGLEMYFDFLI